MAKNIPSIGDSVKPGPHFDYAMYSGPETAEDTGTITAIYEEDGLIDVQWDSRPEGEVYDHTFGDLRGYAVEYYQGYEVVPVE